MLRIETNQFRSFSLTSPSMQTHTPSHGYVYHLQAQKNKALRAKTKRGQPVLAGRMELLLAKIQEQCSQ